MHADVQAATATTVDRSLSRVLARLAEAAGLLGVAEVAALAAETAARQLGARLQRQPGPGDQGDGRSRPTGNDTQLGTSLPEEPVGCPARP